MRFLEWCYSARKMVVAHRIYIWISLQHLALVLQLELSLACSYTQTCCGHALFTRTHSYAHCLCLKNVYQHHARVLKVDVQHARIRKEGERVHWWYKWKSHTLSLLIDERERERESLGNIGNAMNICMILQSLIPYQMPSNSI